MEKFALLNLLKAIDGLQNGNSEEPNAQTEEIKVTPAPQPPQAPQADMPNFIYETLMRHEAMSNRLKRKR